MTDDRFHPTIGLEIHAELKTASKMFCSCKNDPDEERPNINICPVCLAHPGTLPVLNIEAIRQVLRVGLSVGGTLADFTEWDRKNYFYPDIPKGYQISQYKYPLVSGGKISGVEIERIHLEEDTAQSTHDTHKKSLVNFNRAGVPLMELVTKPVIHDAATAVNFAKELRLLLICLGAGEASMEKGQLRVEANISVSSDPSKLGIKTEVKNLNSFRSVERAIEHEIARQSSLLSAGRHVVQETRGWDDSAMETYPQRNKESSHDYRYFPDPDIPKMKISELENLSSAVLAKTLPEVPWNKRGGLRTMFGLTDKETAVFVESPEASSYLEDVIAGFGSDAKKTRLAVNYILTDYMGLLKKNLDSGSGPSSLQTIPPKSFADLITLVSDGDISSRGAKDLIAIQIDEEGSLAKAGDSVRRLAEEKNLIQKSDSAELAPIIERVIAENTPAVAEYRAGKTASLQYLIGQSMKATKGSANPEMVRKILTEKLS